MISYFLPYKNREGKDTPGVKPSEDMTYESYLAYIRDGKWGEDVLNVRAGRKEKTAVPGVTPSGAFSYRATGSLVAHSGVIALDFDAKDNEYFPADEIAMDAYVYAMHRSISGYGWVVYVRIDPDRHADAFLALEKYFANQYQVVVDPSGKDVCRFRFVSYDPDLFQNPSAKTWKKYLPKKTVMPSNKVYIHTENDVEHCINQLLQRGLNIAEEYHDWIRLGMAFAGAYGEQGREYFHKVSSLSHKYDREKCDRKYSNLIKTSGGRVTIASFFWLCQMAGINIKTERTTHIERVAKMQRRVVGKSGGHQDLNGAGDSARKMLAEIDHITGDDVEQIVEQVMQLPEEAIRDERTEDLIAELKEYLRTYDMKFNAVTRRIEVDGEAITDRALNSVYVRCMEVLGPNPAKGRAVTKDLLFSIIDSDFTPEYHPFKDWFLKHANLKPSGEVEKLFASLKVKNMYYDEGKATPGADYVARFVKKWLLSCVASWHGTYSVTMLVLTGDQGTSKTNFFRGLLPDDLLGYYAESTLDDRNKTDSELLMCQKALICNDEYDGKNTVEYKRFKALLSRQTFSLRKPFGKMHEDYTRYAVLCGTSNEEEVINDPTGNRRIIPVPIESIDWEQYKMVDKDALWMELYHEWKQCGEDWMLNKEDIRLLNLLTLSSNQISKEEEAIYMFFDLPENGGYSEFLTNTEILNHIETNTRLKLSQTKLGLVLKKCGFEKQPKKIDGRKQLVYEVVKKRRGMTETPTPF